jgi:hypothetical protein
VDVSLRQDSLHGDDRLIRSWRTAAIVAGAVAAVELLVLVIVSGALIAKPSTAHKSRSTGRAHAAQAAHGTKTVMSRHATAPAAHLQRGRVSVLVLNGNGRHGAAAATASRISRHGYRIRGVANAPRSDFTRSLVMYRRGFEGEGRRLAHDLGIRIVGPLDGLRASQLHGAHAVVVVGA